MRPPGRFWAERGFILQPPTCFARNLELGEHWAAILAEKRARKPLGFGFALGKVMHRPKTLTARKVGEVALELATDRLAHSQKPHAQHARMARQARRQGEEPTAQTPKTHP